MFFILYIIFRFLAAAETMVALEFASDGLQVLLFNFSVPFSFFPAAWTKLSSVLF